MWQFGLHCHCLSLPTCPVLHTWHILPAFIGARPLSSKLLPQPSSSNPLFTSETVWVAINHQILNHLIGIQHDQPAKHPVFLATPAFQHGIPNSTVQFGGQQLSQTYHSYNLSTLQQVHYFRMDLLPGLSSQQLSLARIQKLNPSSESLGPVVSSCLIPKRSASSRPWAKYPHTQHWPCHYTVSKNPRYPGLLLCYSFECCPAFWKAILKSAVFHDSIHVAPCKQGFNLATSCCILHWTITLHSIIISVHFSH